MKNVIKMLGIIALLAIIGGVVGCSVDAEDQTTITISDIPDAYEDNYAAILVYKDNTLDEVVGKTLYAKAIKGGVAKEIALYDDSDQPVIVKEGIIALVIDTAETMDEENRYVGITDKAKTLGKGGFTVSATDFVPDITKVKPAGVTEKPAATNFGTYTTKYTNASKVEITETIVLSETSFNISDNTGGRTGDDADHLNFTIVTWETATVPEAYPEYTGAYKFTGKITAQKGYVPSDKTAPGFVAATDVKADKSGPDCWMYIYFKGETGSITFIRTAFSKEGKVNSGVVTGADGKARVYTKPN